MDKVWRALALKKLMLDCLLKLYKNCQWSASNSLSNRDHVAVLVDHFVTQVPTQLQSANQPQFGSITRYVLRLRRRRLLAKATTVKVLITDIKQNSVVSTANRISSTSSVILWLKGHSCQPCACHIWLFPNGTFDNNKISLSLGIQRQKFLTRLLSLPCWLGSCL